MKRVLAVVLGLLVLISSFSTVLFTGASASNFETVFDDPDNWVVYSIASGLGTTATESGSAFPVAQNTNTAFTFDGDASSLRLKTYAQYATVQFDVKPNTEYTFTYRMLYNGTNSTDKMLSHSAITSVGGTADWGKDGCYDIYTTAGSARCDSGLWQTNNDAVSTTSTRGNVKQWQEGGKWHQVTHSFNSGDNSKMIFVLRYTVANDDNFYLDDFNLTEIYDFEDLNNWGIYNPNTVSNDANYIPTETYGAGDNQLKMSWCNVSTTTAQDADSTGKSIKINGNTFNVAASLPTLKANTKYSLSFKYKPDANTVVAGSTGAYFTSHIIKKGTQFTSNAVSPAEFVADLGKGTETTDWKEISVDFTTDDTLDYMLEFRFAFGGGYVLFLDEFTLTEKEKPTYFIQDFENYTKSSSEYVGTALSIVTPEGTSVSGTKALFYDSSVNGASNKEGDNRVILNPSNSGFPTLTEIVNKGDKFRVTAKYKLLEGEVKFYMNTTTNGASAWSQPSTNPISYKSTTLSAGDTWQEFSYDFTLKADADDNAAKYPMFLIGGSGKAYFDYITVSTLTANVPDVEIPEENIPESDPFETLENWGVYHADSKGDYTGYATVDGTAPAKRDWVNISIDTANTATGTGSSVKLNGNTTLNTVKIPTLKANTDYEITFKYLIQKNATWGSSSKAWFIPGIIKKGTAMNGGNPTEYVQKGTAPNTPASPADGSWKDYTLAFKTDDSTDYFLGITATFASGFVIYLDEFKIEEKQATPDPGPGEEPGPGEDPDPTPTPTDGDYDNAANWKLYHSDFNAPTINNNGLDSYSWIKNTQNTDKAYTYNNGEKSVKFYGNIQYTAVKLANLEQGKAYKVKFMYYAPTTSTVGSSSRAWVNGVGILKGGTAMKSNAPAEYFKKGAVFAGEAGKWHEYSLNFRAETTDLYFGMGLTFGAGFTLYVDDFTVTETDEDPDAPPVVPGKEPQKEVIIDFETEKTGANASLSPKDRMEIVEAEGYDGKTSKMLHFIKGQYTDATTLNYSSTYSTDTDAVFTIGVKPKKVYNLSFRVKANSQTLPEGAKAEWIGIYATFNKQYIVSHYQHNAKRDEWVEYTYSVTTAADQNLLSFYVNAGEPTPDMWIDDIKLVETDYEAFVGWGDEPRDEILINFDDFYVNYDIACASIVDGPERDGKVTKATYLKGGDYDYNVVANYSAVTQYRDPVFTVPCKEDTLYEFSYYIYVPKDTGTLGYFAVYYDWANTWVLRSSGMTERDEWVKKTVRFTTKKGQTQLSLTFNGGKFIPDVYLDDIRLTEISPGVVSYANEESYCEECFNILGDNNLIDEITNSKTKVLKIPVGFQQQYILGITANSSKKSNSRIFLSFDGVNPMNLSDAASPTAIISSDGKSGRYGINFISDTSGYVYLVIENDDGALTFDDPYLFLAKSMSTNLPMGFDKKQKNETLSVNANKGELKELVVFGSEEDSNKDDDSDAESNDDSNNDLSGNTNNEFNNDSFGESENNSNNEYEDYTEGNPSTGSGTVLPVVILFITLLVTCVLLQRFKKGGEQA